MFNKLAQWLVGLAQRKVGGSMLKAGDQVFMDRLFWAKYRFRSMRATYYGDLAKRILHMPGEPVSNHFAKDAARRVGEPVGVLAAHWLARSEGIDGQMQRSRLTEIFRGTIPDEDIPILAVAEEGGDIRDGLETLSRNLTALGEARAGIAMTLAGVVMTVVILHAYLGALAFLIGPAIDKSFSTMLDVSQYGPIASTFHHASTFLRHWGWLLVIAEVAAGVWVVRALTRYVGRYRGWLDRKMLAFDFFRRFQSAQFLAGLSAVTKKFGGDARNLLDGLVLMRANAYPYLAYHIERIELNLEYAPNEGGKVFDTGLFDRDTSYRIQDIAEYESDLSKMLHTVSEDLLKTTPQLMQQRASRFNRRATIILIVIITALAFMPAFMAQGTFSHEPPGTLDLFRLVGSRHPVYIADRIHQVALRDGEFTASDGALFAPIEIEALLADGTPEVVFTCVPTVNKAMLAAAVGAKEAATAVGDHLAAYLHAAGSVNRALRARGIRTMGISHGTVNGCQTEHGVPMAGFDHEFTIGALFDAECDGFMLGHIHRAQQWDREGRLVAYPGSIGRFHYGEIGDKTYLQWRVAPGQAETTPIVTPARETLCIDFDGPPDMAELARIAAEASDKFVRIRWVVDEEHRQVVDRDAIGALFLKATEVKLEGRVLPAVRSRAEGISHAASLSEKVTRWGELTHVDTNPLLDRLSMLEYAEPQAIADLVLQQLESVDKQLVVAAPAALSMPMLSEPVTAVMPVPIEVPVPIARQASPPPAAMDWLSDDLFAEAAA